MPPSARGKLGALWTQKLVSLLEKVRIRRRKNFIEEIVKISKLFAPNELKVMTFPAGQRTYFT